MKKECHDKLFAKLRVKNSLGLHTRPATTIVKLLRDVKSDVQFSYKKMTVDAKSILSILMLAVPKNGVITASAEGIDAQEALVRLQRIFEGEFGE